MHTRLSTGEVAWGRCEHCDEPEVEGGYCNYCGQSQTEPPENASVDEQSVLPKEG